MKLVAWVILLVISGCKDKGAGGGSTGGFGGRDPRLVKALEARTEPPFAMAPHVMEPLGRCGVTIRPRPASEGIRVLGELNKRNGGGFTSIADMVGAELAKQGVKEPTLGADDGATDPFSQFFVQGVRMATPPAGKPIGEDEALTLGIAFLVKNYDLFGLTKDDLRAATISTREQGPMRELQFDAEGGMPGYETLLERSWRVLLSVGPDRQVAMVTVQGPELLPPFKICTDFKVTPEQAKAAVTGVSIDSVTPTIHVEYTDDRTRKIRLAYRIDVGDKMYSHFVDADTKEVLEERQNFVN